MGQIADFIKMFPYFSDISSLNAAGSFFPSQNKHQVLVKLNDLSDQIDM